MDYCSASASASPNSQWVWRVIPQEFRWLSWMFKSSWSSLSSLERFVSTSATRISQSPCYVTQLSGTDSSRSLYISSALLTLEIQRENHYSDFEDHIWYQAFLSFSPVLWRQWAEGRSEPCRGAALSCLGSWRKDKAQSPVRQLHLHWPLQFPRFQRTAGKSSCLPALTPAPHRKKAALTLLPEQEEEEGRKHREGENTSGINWRVLNALERTAELAETIARSRMFGRDSEAKVENETYAAYLNTKPELFLRLWGFFHASS